MSPSKEYMDQIAKKLDSFNEINGVNPSIRSDIFGDNFDMMDHMGKSALDYINKKKSDNTIHRIDPLFTDHNKY